jgi:DNA alkylation damage repair protein AlkB
LSEAVEPPATTNHTQQYGALRSLWSAALHDAVLDGDGRTWRSREEADIATSNALAATALLRRLRWAALGTPYDWSSRSYVPQADIRAVAAPFTELASALCTALVGHLRGDVALVNLYGTGCTLSGHLDDAEADGCETAPIVSISLGVPAILLLQNAAGSGDDSSAVTPLLLRSGDIVVLSGQARRARHGVPRVFTPSDAAPSRAAAHDAATAALLAASAAAHGRAHAHGECCGVSDGILDADCSSSQPCCACSLASVPAWLHHHRINISIRDMELGARLAESQAAPSALPGAKDDPSPDHHTTMN